MDRISLKNMAKQQIKGNIGVLFMCSLLVAAISALLMFVPIIGSIASSFVVAPAFSLALTGIYLSLTHGNKPQIGDIFSGFNEFWGAFKVTFFVGLFTMLWSLLFVIPGIIAAFSYSMSMYILAENPDMPALEVIRRSKEMMRGRKMDLFVLGLSFLGWILLVYVTFGIAIIWVGPYMQATTANFYNAVKSAPDEHTDYVSTDF